MHDDSGKRTAPTDPGRPRAPKLPEEANASQLDPEVRRDFRALPKMVAEDVGAHVVAVGMLLEQEPEKALEHARYARRKASRSPAAREANGLAAYYVGNWSEALSELRAARRMGGQSHLAIIADCERALGKPQRALELTREEEATRLPQDEAIELRIVGAGARRDLGQSEAAVVSLQIPELDPQRNESWSARLFYAYADNLLAVGRTREAFTWFVHAANADDDEATDAPERLEELVTELGGPEEAERLAARAETDTTVSDVSEGTGATDREHGTGDPRADRRSADSHDIDLGVWD
ncbi:tetratricopeptide repeat protein [Actinopolyspora mzabensis]|uniref:tetratricopeptide repeat protein n=1 Tax=Actinopolyspora mzabensis TaxID=995066 RepID=UPI0015A44385|nr:tetratricopeptide repeat protein [Actinopolyspora mzabensis]